MHTTYTTEALSQLLKDIRALKYRKKSETGWGRGTEENRERKEKFVRLFTRRGDRSFRMFMWRAISIFIEPRKAGLIFITLVLAMEGNDGFAVVTIRNGRRLPFGETRSTREIEQGRNRDAPFCEQPGRMTPVSRPLNDGERRFLLRDLLPFHCLEECETRFL